MFLLDKFDVFIDKNIDAQLSQYLIFKQKKMARLSKKKFFKKRFFGKIYILTLLSNIYMYIKFFLTLIQAFLEMIATLFIYFIGSWFL